MVDSALIIRKSTLIVKNTLPIDKVYTLEKKALGKGTYGEVSKCKHKESG